MILFYLFLMLPIAAWAIAEFKATLGLRMLIGVFAFLTVGFVCYQTASVKPALEITDLRACLSEINKLNARGDFEKIDAAFRVYESDIKTGRSEYHARIEMLATLRLTENTK